MKQKIFLGLLLVFITGRGLIAQSLLWEDFSGTFPPTGWTIDQASANWSASNTNNAGEVAPEVMFNFYPDFNGVSRFISPAFNLTGVTKVNLEFHHMLDNYSGGYTVGVATRNGSAGTWHVAWQIVVGSTVIDLSPAFVSVPIQNSDVNHPDFQFCFFFSGNTVGIYYWYIDNVYLYIPYAHDIRSENILISNQFAAGNPFTPSFSIRNIGRNDETFPAVFKVLDYQNNPVYKDSTMVTGLAMDSVQIISFTNFAAPEPDALYKAVFYTNLSNDMDRTNDTLFQYINTYTHSKQNVMMETGTGTWCNYCPGAAMGADNLISHGDSVAVIENHTQDIFTNTSSLGRISYYQIALFPTAIFDGTNSYAGGSHGTSMYPNYLPLYRQQMHIKTPFAMFLYGSHSGNDYSIDINVQKLGQFIDTRTVLQLALTESHIAYAWEGQDSLQYVNRLMVPGYHGTPIDMTSVGSKTLHFDFSISSFWMANNLELSTFIQDTVTREIFNGNKIKLSDLVIDGIQPSALPCDQIGKVYPNPFGSFTMIPIDIQAEGQVTICIYSILGLEVKNLYHGILSTGVHNLRWDGTDDQNNPLPAGIYYCKMSRSGNIVSQKIIRL